MKRFIALAMIITMAAALIFSVSAADVNFNAAKGTAVIDCVKDDAYLAADEITIAYGATADTASGKAWALWDDKALYFYAEIADKTLSGEKHADDTVWQRDSCEFYVDFTNAHEDSDITTINAGQYTTGLPYSNGEFWGGYGQHWTTYSSQSTYKTKVVDGGWVVETMIVYGDEFKPSSGAVIGFTMAINDDTDDTDGREYQMMISEGQENSWSTTGAFYDRLTLSEQVYVPPAPETEAPAVDEPVQAPVITTPAAQTSDLAGMAVLVSIITLAGVIIAKKK
ncbi:MAG: sugar-binding protein [Eubacteriales bacterium]|nr:sugar-binding protein [Eubacteriales bacterium]